ncbi:hypothetical protein [Actinoplanes sp. G11-F43]|uniref:hypothetical protein n=1 Tax=Actinoplanes sp. G11-F43 TaxID=3424130 RepID=UPI003D34CB64
MSSGFQVDAESLRADATAVTGFAARVSALTSRVPPPVPTPRWAATGAATDAADIARRWVSVLGHDISETADRVRSVAGDYEEADTRAAARLRAPR